MNILHAIVLLAVAVVAGPVMAQDGVLTGDQRLACEAVLCLASGTRPTECTPSLQRYFSISYSDFRDTIRGRVDFLRQCPASNQTAEMSSLVDAMGNGAGRCDSMSLNLTLRSARWVQAAADRSTLVPPMVMVVYISDQMPGFCSAYLGHQYTFMGGAMPKYVGVPERGGLWVDAANYDAALAEYTARVAAEDAAAAAQQGTLPRGNYWWRG